MSVNQKIKEFIFSMGMSIADFAASIGASHSTISSITNNPDGNPSMATLQKIKAAYPSFDSFNEKSLPKVEEMKPPAPGDRGNPVRAIVLSLMHDYCTRMSKLEGTSYEEIRTDVMKGARLILGGLDQLQPGELDL